MYMIYVKFVGNPLNHEPRLVGWYDWTSPVKFSDIKSTGLCTRYRMSNLKA